MHKSSDRAYTYKMKKVAVFTDPLYLKHSGGPDHPERPERLVAIGNMLDTFPFRDRIVFLNPRDATEEELKRIHTVSHIRKILQTAEQQYYMLDADTGTCADSWAASLRAAGGAICAVDAVMKGDHGGSLAFVRPPGHHAESDRAMGFCLFNNAAVAALHASKIHGLKRILIVDWDVHHGNGTMHSFYPSKQVLYFSIHQYPHYPGTGAFSEVGSGPGKGYTVNVPLQGGQGDGDYIKIFREIFHPIALEYRPELIIISAGFDAHEDDPLASMVLTGKGFGLMTSVLKDVAAECCPGRIAVVLEGGYSLKALTDSISEVILCLLDEWEPPKPLPDTDSSYLRQVIENVKQVQSVYWKCLT